MTLAVDHLVIAASTLAQGQAWCEQTLGVTPGPGGRHALMSTHNRLLRIASAGFPRAYLEIIAIDPDAPEPGRARWFGLDDPSLKERLAQHGPQLIHWVARCDHIDTELAWLRGQGQDAGVALAAQRATPDGLLQWQIAVRDDGRLRCQGALPTLIQWGGPHSFDHPVDRMADSGIALGRLEVSGLPAALAAWLPASVSPPAQPSASPCPLSATLHTPRGAVTLSAFA